MFKEILLAIGLLGIEGAPAVVATPPLSNGHLSVLTFSRQMDSCQFNRDSNLSFFTTKGQTRALASLPHAYKESTVKMICQSGEESYDIILPVGQAEYEERKLKVDNKFTDKKSDELKARIAKEKNLVDNALAQTDDKRYWSGQFFIPREDKVTSPYGARRTYNGVQKSVHFGLDIDGQLGDHIYAMAAGRVALASRDHFYPGTIVILDHGQGLQSLYMHMSELAVKTGDMVKKGQLIGLVGQSGRVTGPHLHWGTKLHGNYFYPFDLYSQEVRALLE